MWGWRRNSATSSGFIRGTADSIPAFERPPPCRVRLTAIRGSPPALEGIRVLDFSRVIAGPLCTQQLADLGADVIKVEHPVTGDEMRARSSHGDRRGAGFLAFNRSKRSIALDLVQPRGQDIARRLAAVSDVVVENFRPGVMD